MLLETFYEDRKNKSLYTGAHKKFEDIAVYEQKLVHSDAFRLH